jgi:hypothetical protein
MAGGWVEVMRQGHLDPLVRSFLVRMLTRRELTQFLVVVVFWPIY